ncbi:hypothetical protein BGZ63DRAFT_424520 [Mariannaea sp. PMI_226]|nr:hypothetical protein BGZ63DRAFT_424520 [Mariannaea sp. PMI_226]
MSLTRSIPRLLRSQPRLTAGVSAPLLRPVQVRPVTYGVPPDGDLGGPGGQMPPSFKPGGPEMLSRNWIPMAGGALALLLGIKYMSSFDKPPRTTELDMRASNSTEIGYMPQATPNSKPLNRDTEVQAFTEMSGRKGGGSMGPFRAE